MIGVVRLEPPRQDGDDGPRACADGGATTRMPESFHAMLSRMDRDGRLLWLSKEVDARHLSALVVMAERPAS